jgi:uncharacterized protein (TIGR03435 family)
MKLAITILFSALAFAQKPAIEVASVKPNTSGDSVSNTTSDPQRERWHNTTLWFLIRDAYHLKNYQLAPTPPWVDSDHWDVEATTNAPVAEAQMMDLMQGVLAERFKLKTHFETRPIPGYRLSVAKGGPRMKVFEEKTGDGGSRLQTRMQVGLYEAHGATMAQLIKQLSGSRHAPVDDATGLTGKYDFELEWAATPKQEETRPSIYNAIQSLGLRLDAV